MIRDTDSPAGAPQKLVFEYDHQGRRIRKQFFTYSGGWQEQTDTIFLYDAWNLIAELDANASNARVRTYVWGTDLSGTMHGASGVGGLLKLTYYGTSTTNVLVAYDGNGNVTALIDAANGSICARYEYGPFAERIRSSASLSKQNPIRFSTKYTDNESGFLYYGYRYYNPSTGRWLRRDPIGEDGGENLYGFLGNDPVVNTDLLGLEWQIWRSGEARARVHATSTGDTIESLAQKIQLNASEYKQWLREADGSPLSNITPWNQCWDLSVPNTAYVNASSYSWGPLGWYLIHYGSNLRSTWKAEGLKVVYTSTWSTTKDSIVTHFGSGDIYKYAYIGHGASGQLTGLNDPTGKGDDKGILAAGKYTKYGIARMEITACESNDRAYMWKKNVSKAGVLRTVKGLFKLFNMNFVDEGGE